MHTLCIEQHAKGPHLIATFSEPLALPEIPRRLSASGASAIAYPHFCALKHVSTTGIIHDNNGLDSVCSKGRISFLPLASFVGKATLLTVLFAHHQTLIVPAIIALLFFVIATYILFPLWQRYRSSRYGAYLPLESISSGTLSLRYRMQNAIARWLVPSAWRERIQDRLVVAVGPGSDSGYNSEEGEELDEVPEDDDIRERLEREARRSRNSGRPDLERRLSRE